MKQFIYLIIFLLTGASFGQNTGIIVGKILDNELNNSPLVLANVTIKDTEIEANTDLTGLFVLENIKDGDYILVCSFAGYETQEIKVHVDSQFPTELKLSLSASTISLNELASIYNITRKDDKSLSSLN